jgi:hypothetical protein
VQEHIERGSGFLQEHKLNEALAEANEALRLDPASASAQAFKDFVTIAWQAANPQKADTAATPSPSAGAAPAGEIPRHSGVVLDKDTVVILRLSEDVSSGPDQRPAPKIQVFQDVKVGNLVVIAKGTQVTYATEKQAAGNMTQPGSVALNFTSVRSVMNDEVRLVGVQGSAEEKAQIGGCPDPFCMAGIPIAYVLARLLPGKNARLQKGTLIYAQVGREIVFDPKALTELNRGLNENRAANVEVASSKARLHFYTDESGFSGGIGIRVDGVPVGRLVPPHYACAELDVGSHLIRIGKQTFNMNLESGKEYFLLSYSLAGEVWTNVTDGYQSVSGTPVPGSLRKPLGVDCWDETSTDRRPN